MAALDIGGSHKRKPARTHFCAGVPVILCLDIPMRADLSMRDIRGDQFRRRVREVTSPRYSGNKVPDAS